MKSGVVVIVLLPLVIWGLLLDLAHVGAGGSIDLRNRVTGARIAAAGIDPYSYKWQRGDPETFCDLRNEPLGLLSKTTVTPWTLALHAPLNRLPYRTIQWIWLLFQYVCLGLGVWVWFRGQEQRLAGWGLALALLFCLSPAWRHHVDHGQVYGCFAGLFLILAALNRSLSARGSAGCGLISSFLIAARPSFVPLLPALFRPVGWPRAGGFFFGGAFAFVLPVAMFGPKIWSQYREAMSLHAELYLTGYQITPKAQSYPATIENIPIDALAGFARNIPFADTSIYKLISFQLPPVLLLGTWLLVGTGCLLWLGWIKKAGPDLLGWVAAALIFMGDFLLPAFRHNYNDVLALPVILLGLTVFRSSRWLFHWAGGAAGVLLLMTGTWLTPKWTLPMPSMLLGMMAFGGVVWSLGKKPGTLSDQSSSSS